jgi:hypothetical protein
MPRRNDAAYPQPYRPSRPRRREQRQTRSSGDAVGTYVGDAWSLAKRTAYGLNEIRKLINVEHKYIDFNSSGNINQSGFAAALSLTAQGDNVTEREGDSIKIQSFELCASVSRGAAAPATQYDAVRVMVVRDLQNTGSVPLVSDILETVGTVTAPYQPVDFLNGSDLNKRFTIVYDELLVLDPSNPIKMVTFKTMHDCHTFYRGTTNAIGSAGNGTYFLVCVSNAAATVPSIDYSTRIRFTDN